VVVAPLGAVRVVRRFAASKVAVDEVVVVPVVVAVLVRLPRASYPKVLVAPVAGVVSVESWPAAS